MRFAHFFVLLAASPLPLSNADDNAPPIESAPFASERATAESTLFTAMPETQTGLIVDNQYDDPNMWGRRYREFMGGGMGSGVAAGDFDADGKVDLFVSLKTKPGRLFRNLGDWTFADVTDEAGLSEESSFFSWFSEKEAIWRQGAVFADVDNDGWLDLYVCRNNAPNLLYMNQGNGTFREEAERRGLDLVDGSVVGAFADYDRDGWLDVLVLTNQVEGNEPDGRLDRLFHNNGNGTFTEVTQSAGIDGPTFGHAATWFDYDGDKWPDLYLANDFSGPDYLYRNNRDGTFANVLDQVAPHSPYSSMGADTTDVNNDTSIDLLVSDMATIEREKNQRGLAASRGDVLSVGTTEGVAPQYTRNALLLNTGLGVFGEAACWAGIEATDWTWSVRFEDFDNDGWTDLHVTNGMVREANNSDLLARMMRALSDMQRIAVIKRAPPLEESNLAYRNRAGNGYEPVTEQWGLTDVGVSFGAATADLDGDGDLDLAYLDYNGGLKTFRNNAAENNRIQVRLTGVSSNRFGAGAIVRIESPAAGTQSRSLTIARGYASGSELVAHFGLGPDERLEQLVVEWPSGVVQRFADLPANRSYRVTERGAPSPKPTPEPRIYRNAAADYRLALEDASSLAIPDKEQPLLPFRTDRAGPALAVADVNGDGAEDLFLGATTGSPPRLLLWQDNAYRPSDASDLAGSGLEHGPALAFDADGDGDRDLLLTHASAEARSWPDRFRPTLFENDGRGGFQPTQALPPIPINAGAAVAADVDGDGDLDLFIGGRSIPGRYPETPRSALLINDRGSFTDQTQALAPQLVEPGLVKSALFRDVDRDGRPDLILALEWNFVRYFRNLGQGRFEDRSEPAGFASGGRGWWNGLAAADVNGDGYLDFVAGNLGQNTTYEASPEAPATLFYGDFAQNGTRLIVEAVYDQGELYPLRSRIDLGAKLPSVLRRFPQNDPFAKATLIQAFGDAPVASAQRFEADNFDSGLFLSRGDGSYRFVAFPPAAQIGPLIAPLILDADGDGRLDIVASQNSDIAIPRFHGGVGLLLAGNGDGSFRPLRPSDSGIAITGNGRATAAIDPNRDQVPEVLVARHGAEGLLLQREESKSPWIAIRLLGSIGNRDAIGAALELRFSDASIRHHQIGIGGGWHTQETPILYLPAPPHRKLESLEVTWPDGTISTHSDVPAAGLWQIEFPMQR